MSESMCMYRMYRRYSIEPRDWIYTESYYYVSKRVLQETAEAVLDLVANKTLNKNQVDNAKNLKIVTLMHNLIEYIDNYGKY